MLDATALFAKLEAHISSLTARMEAMESTQTTIPQDEIKRDIAIGIDLYQRYIDLLDEVKEEIENGETA